MERKYRTNDDRWYQKITNETNKLKIECKHCKRKVVVPFHLPKNICSWCGHYVYRDKKLEFKENLKKELRKNDNKN